MEVPLIRRAPALEVEEARALLCDRHFGPSEAVRSRTDRPYGLQLRARRRGARQGANLKPPRSKHDR